MRRGGAAWLTATRDGATTRLTRVSHRTPVRLLPLVDTNGRRGAAHCAIGGYGGGLLGGDTIELSVRVEPGAKLCLTTQASTKVYCTKPDALVTRQTLSASVGAGGLLVLAPDPVVPYANSTYEQDQTFKLGPDASLVAVDWVGSGRVSRGERWAFTSFSSRNAVHRVPSSREETAVDPSTSPVRDEQLAVNDRAGTVKPPSPDGVHKPQPPSAPLVIDSMRLLGGPDGPARLGFEMGGVSYNSAVTVLCSGREASKVTYIS